MFDDIEVRVPVQHDCGRSDYQTKSLICYLDRYEIRADGTLWHEEYDTVDRSDPTKEGLMGLRGMLAQENQRWVQVTDFTGEITFHHGHKRGDEPGYDIWHEYSTYFVDGRLKVGPIDKSRFEPLPPTSRNP